MREREPVFPCTGARAPDLQGIGLHGWNFGRARGLVLEHFEPMQAMSSEIRSKAPGAAAMLIIDMINDLDFDGGDALAPLMAEAARRIAGLRDDARRAGIPVLYVNDNFGEWHSERSRLIERCERRAPQLREIIDRIRPRHEDYFVIKPHFSGFYATNLPVLLPKLGVRRLILTGVAADICVLFTAADAHMRDYSLWVPRDCVAGSSPRHTDWALTIMRKSMDAEVRAASELALDDWL